MAARLRDAGEGGPDIHVLYANMSLAETLVIIGTLATQ